MDFALRMGADRLTSDAPNRSERLLELTGVLLGGAALGAAVPWPRSPKKSNVLLDAGAGGLEGLVEVELKSDSKVSSTGFELVLILLPPD